ncbi:MAG: Crp/Fnr family transcriptional regulator [Pyrinomonadaceae bacterium]
MGNSTKLCVTVENRLLAALPKKEYQRLLPGLELVTLAFSEVLYQPGERIEHVYFPNNGLIALTSPVNERSTTAVNLVGNDGMTGICVFLGEAISPTPAIVLVAGKALKMKASLLRKESRHASLERLLLGYTQSLLMQSQQGIICNHFHKIYERLSCWLLYIQDAAEASEFPMTHKFLSNMMGVRREEVSKAAHALQQDKLISYSRGHVRILNRAGLKAASCECYRISKRR